MPWTEKDDTGVFSKGIFFSWKTPDRGGISLQMANNATRLTATAIIDYDNLNEFVRAMLGWPEIYTIFPNGQPARCIVRRTPYLWLDLLDNSGNPYLYCQSVQQVEGISPVGNYPLTGTPRYRFAEDTLTFASVPYGIVDDNSPEMWPALDTANDPEGAPFYDAATSSYLGPDESTLARYVSTGGDPFDRAISIPTGLMRAVYDPGDLVPQPPNNYRQPAPAEPGPYITESMGMIEPGWDRQYTHHLVPEVPVRTILQAIGTVNSREFGGFPAGTLLCLAPKIRPYNSPLGTIVFDIDYRFRYIAKIRRRDLVSVGHNWFLRRVTRGNPLAPTADIDYRLVTLSGLANGRPTYTPFDFRKLFRPDQP